MKIIRHKCWHCKKTFEHKDDEKFICCMTKKPLCPFCTMLKREGYKDD